MGNFCNKFSSVFSAVRHVNAQSRETKLSVNVFKMARDKLAAYGQTEAERSRIHALPLLELRDHLQQGNLSATQVLYAYAHYALLTNERLNCIAEFLPEAFQEAEALDAKYVNSGEKKPPLFGLPFSVKANMFVKGYDCCIGNARWLGNPSTHDCTLVVQLRLLGAIPFCLTNVPQTLISFVCSNPVYGTTGNPHSPKRTPGGSSGGEAALLGGGGTAFATGGDIAGSLRIPAHFCGLTTLKPGQNRFEIEYVHTGVPGHGRLGLGTGVFTKSVEELILLLSHLIGDPQYHRNLVPKSPPLPLDVGIVRDIETKAKSGGLRIGYHFNDGFLKPVPACARVVEESVAKLRELGNEMVLFQVPDPEKAAGLLFRNVCPDGGAYFHKIFSQNPIDKYMKKPAFLLKIPFFVRSMLAIAMNWFSPQLAVMLRSYVRSASDIRESQAALDAYVLKFTQLWQEAGLDALIVPAFPVPAVPHRWPSDLLACAFATGLYNMLDFPAGIVPCGTVSAEDDAALKSEKQWAVGANLLLKYMREAAADSIGLPLGVQVVTLRWEEEKCLGLMKALEEAMKKN